MQVSLHITSITAARKHHTRNKGIFVGLRRLGGSHIAPEGYRKIIQRGVTETTKEVVKSAQVESVKARHTDMMMQLIVVESTARSSGTASVLPATSVGLLLHHGGRDRGWRAGNPHTGTRINNGNGVASAQCRRLVNLHRVAVVGLEASRSVVEAVRHSGQRKCGCDLLAWLDLLLQGRGFRGAT